jgi:predicted transcriptional regulator
MHTDYMASPTTIRLEPDQLERVKRLAGRTHRTQSNLIRLALFLGLAEIEAHELEHAELANPAKEV